MEEEEEKEGEEEEKGEEKEEDCTKCVSTYYFHCSHSAQYHVLVRCVLTISPERPGMSLLKCPI